MTTLTCPTTSRLAPPITASALMAARATRILAFDTDENARARVPVGCDQRGDMLFASSATMIGGRIAINMLAARLGCDAVDVVRQEDGQLRFSLAVRLHWKMLWHDDYRMWRPQHGGPACFVSSDPADTVWFRIEDGRLRALKDDLPFNNERGRIMGLRLADAGLRRLMEGC